MKNHTILRSRWTSAAALAMVCLAACTPTLNAPAPTSTTSSPAHLGYQVPDLIKFSEHWTPTGAVDLMGPDGTFIRAFIESAIIKDFSRSEDPTYPGYDRANQTNRQDISAYNANYGYTARRVLSLEEHPDNTITAFICSYVSINPTNKDSPATSGLTLRYHRTGTPPPANQKGPVRAPTVSVFGDWYATFYGYDGDSHTADNRCIERQPVIDKSLVSTPGWPAQAV